MSRLKNAAPILRDPAQTWGRARRLVRQLSPVALAASLLLSTPAGAVDYFWGSGAPIGGDLPVAITIDDTLTLGCFVYDCGAKYLNQSFLNNGTVYASDNLHFQYVSQVFTNGWQYRLQGDVGLVNVYAGGTFINTASGGLVKTAGTGTSTISISLQSAGGSILDAVTGTLELRGASSSFDAGAILLANPGATIALTGGVASFADGVHFYGTGQYEIGTDAQFGGAVGAAHLRLSNGQFTGGDGTAGSRATLTSDATWAGSGALAGSWLVAAGRTLTATAGGNHYIRGTVDILGTLETGAPLYFEHPSYTLNNAGTLSFNGDVGLVNVYAGGTLVNTGTLRKAAGTGVSDISGINVVNNGGTVDVASGVLRFGGGTQYFNDGTRFTGAGEVQLQSSARLAGRIDSQNLVLAGASYEGGDGGSQPVATLHGRTRWEGGSLTGQWVLAADHQLQITAAGNHYVRGNVLNHGLIQQQAPLYFEYPSYVLDNRGTLDLQGDVGFINVYAGGTLLNSGRIVKSAGAGTAVIQGLAVGVAGTGELAVQAGTLQFAGSQVSFDTGARMDVAAGAELRFDGGNLLLADGVSLQGVGRYTLAGNAQILGALGAANLVLSNGQFTGGDGTAGSRATLTSEATWAGSGALAGSWLVAAGRTLTATAGGNHYIRGTVDILGTLETGAPLYFEYPSYTLNNAGTLSFNGDVGLVNVYAGGTLVNTGTLRKAAGTGVSDISGINVVNNGGTVDVASGVLRFGGGTQYFNDGTRFTGAGEVQLQSSARLAGRIDSQNLVLAGASYEGGDGGSQPVATLHGRTRWEGGSLTGQWVLAADHQLQITAAGNHYVRGNVLNHGLIQQQAPLYFEYPSYVLDNRGTLDLQGDVGFINVYAGGTLLNSGRIVKSAGAGEADLSSITVSNTGDMLAQSGAIRLRSNFVNEGLLGGNGQFTVDGTLTNQGHLAPGASPGTLTLNTHLLMAAGSALDIELQDATHHDLLQVNGNLTLGGTLALSCFGACHFSVGTDLLIVDGTGSLSGSFDSVTLAGFAPGSFTVNIDSANADVWLHVNQNIAAVPEPETWALWLAGLGALGLLRGRRRSNGV